jgi:hypothetical protein
MGVGVVLLVGACSGENDSPPRVATPAQKAPEPAAPISFTGTKVWEKRIGGADFYANYAIATDPNDDIWIAGNHPAGSDIAPTTCVQGWFLMHLSTMGDVRSTTVRCLDTQYYEMGRPISLRGLAIAEDGRLYLAGKIAQGTTDLGAGPVRVTSSGSAFIAAYDPNGAFLWSRIFPSRDNAEAQGIAVRRDGQIAAAGVFSRSIDWGEGEVAASTDQSSPTADAFVVTLDREGTLSAKRTIPFGGGLTIGGVGWNPSDNVLFSGQYYGKPAFWPSLPPAPNPWPLGFTLIFDASLAPATATTAVGAFRVEGSAMADNGEATLGGDDSRGTAHIVRTAADGSPRWAIDARGEAGSVAIHPNGDVAAFIGLEDSRIVRLDGTNGAQRWQVSLADALMPAAFVASDSSNATIVVGSANISLGARPDLYIAKFAP